MKKISLALCLTAGLAVSARAHVPEGQVLLAYQFTAGSRSPPWTVICPSGR